MWLATPASPAFGLVDLLSVVMHELGHVLGLEHVDPSVDADDLMSTTLDVGARRLVTETTLDQVALEADAGTADTQSASMLVFDDASGAFQAGDDTAPSASTEGYILDVTAFGAGDEDEAELDEGAALGTTGGDADAAPVASEDDGQATASTPTGDGSLIDWADTFNAPTAPLGTFGNDTKTQRGLVQFPEFVAPPEDDETGPDDNTAEGDPNLVLQADAGWDMPMSAPVNASLGDTRDRKHGGKSG